MRFYLRVTALLLAVACGNSLQAQHDYNNNLWFRGSVEIQPSERWMIRQENYVRRTNWIEEWQQFVSRSLIQYRSPESMLWSAGYAFNVRYPYGKYNPQYTHVEHQFLLQHLFTPKLFDRWQPVFRARFEYRWLQQQSRERVASFDPDGLPEFEIHERFVESSRVRLQLGLQYDLNKAKTWRIETLHEDFFNLDKPLYRQRVSQHRAMLGFSHKLSPALTVSAWLLHQWIRPGQPRSERNFTPFIALNWRVKTFRNGPEPR